MAIIRNPTDLDSPINYVATLAFFCCVSCTILMLKFRGFKASLDFSSWRKDDEIATPITLTGAYRINRDEFYGNGRVYDPPKKLDPSMVKLPPSFDPEPNLRPNKSTSNLVQPNLPSHIQLHKSTNDVSLDPRGGPSTPVRSSAPLPPERKNKDAKNREKEQKKLEKQRQAEEKARQKAAAQEQAKQEKLRKEREKRAAQEQAKQEKLRKEREKRAAQEQARAKKNKKAPEPPQPVPSQSRPPPPAPSQSGPPPSAPSQSMPPPPAPAQRELTASGPVPPPPPPGPLPAAPYSTNTLDSSISRSSGPPPYSEMSTANPQEPQTGNSNPNDVSFGKPIDKPTDSWDLISQHRQQMSRPVASGVPKGPRKHMVMDLQYKLGPVENKDNSEA